MRVGIIQSAFKLFYLMIFIGVLSACAEITTRWDPQAYTVMKGDTLYSIAWRYEKDFRQIAEWNNIQPPYAIYPGQRIAMQAVSRDGTVSNIERPQVMVKSSDTHAVIKETPQPVKQVPVKQKRTQTIVQNDDTLFAIARREGYSHHQIARWNRLKSPYVLKPGQTLRLSPPLNSLGQTAREQQQSDPIIKPLVQNNIKASTLASPQASSLRQKEKLPVRVSKWQWPAKGRVTKTYKSNDTSRKGIGISGKLGQPVKAAASGTVVYSGNGLINYGNLVIIKHSHSFLSAYAHNKSLLVKEGDSVKPGQTIAKMGSHDSNKPRLHFEIRRNGKPVNPLNYLPKS